MPEMTKSDASLIRHADHCCLEHAIAFAMVQAVFKEGPFGPAQDQGMKVSVTKHLVACQDQSIRSMNAAIHRWSATQLLTWI